MTGLATMKNTYHNDEGDRHGCCCSCCGSGAISKVLTKFHVVLNRSFYFLGKTVAENKGYFILIPLFLSALCMTGFQRIYYEDDPEYLFAPSTGAARGERAIIEENFSLNFTDNFDPLRITRTGRFARFIVIARDGGTILRQSVWEDIDRLDKVAKEVSIEYDKKIYGFKDICAISKGECYENQVLKLGDFIGQVENGTMQLHYPINFEPFLIPHYFGGIQTDERKEVILSAKAITLFYWLRTNNEEDENRGKLWEKEILKVFENTSFKKIRVTRFTSTTLEDELENNTNSVKPFVGVTLTIMTMFSVFVCIMGDWVRGKPLLGMVGIVTAVLSSFTAFGFLIYIGVPFIGINMAAPFLMLGIGIDDSFVMLAAWRRTRLQDSVSERLAQTYSEAAVSITITSLTDMISFFVGVLTPFPSVQIFCLYTGTAVFVTYIWHITLFGGCLAVAGYAEKDQRHSLLFVRVKPKSQVEKENCCYSAFCGGGISETDPWNPRDNQDHMIMVIFRDYIGTFLNIPAMKTFVICVFVLYLGGAIFGCLRVKEGLEKRRLSRYDSYSVDFYDLEDKYFRVYPYSVQVAITGNVTYSDPQTKSDLLELMSTFENETYIKKQYTQSIIRFWYKFLDENAEWLEFNITDEKSYITYLREVYVSDPTDVLNLDIKYNEDYTRILATRFILQTYMLENSNADKDMMEGLRAIAKNSTFNVTVFNPYFVFFDQLVLVRSLSIQAISLAAMVMMIVSFIFIPNPWCSMWVGFSIISIEVGVVGYMTMWGVSLDSISMINLIMCIGFSVDFSAHISYAYLTAKVETPSEKVKECLFSLGLPIVQGGLSTILGVVALNFAPSYIFVTFFKIVFLVIFFGIMHGIFLLPVMLSLVGPGSFKTRKTTPIYDPGEMIMQKCEMESSPVPVSTKNSSSKLALKESQPPEKVILQSGAFLAPAVTQQSNKYQENTEKDMGIGTSGEESSQGSSQDQDYTLGGGPTVVEIIDGTKRDGGGGGPNKNAVQSFPIKEVYSNKGYVSDQDVEEDSKPHHTSQQPLGRRSKHPDQPRNPKQGHLGHQHRRENVSHHRKSNDTRRTSRYNRSDFDS